MPKLIDYPRTTYAGAWELSEVVDDTGGKCAIDTAARKLNRKVSGSFKAIIGSAVKFGLLTSKRDLLSTTTLFRRIKHAYDKQEELLFHREAFLTPPLFTQLCRKFRSRELPVQMLDVMLIREFSVEEINAQGVAKAFTDGARMVGLLDEHNIVADIDQLAAKQPPRRELASAATTVNAFRHETTENSTPALNINRPVKSADYTTTEPPKSAAGPDAIASLFGLHTAIGVTASTTPAVRNLPEQEEIRTPNKDALENQAPNAAHPEPMPSNLAAVAMPRLNDQYQIQISGPGIDTQLTISHEDDLLLLEALLNKIRRQLKS